MDQPVIIGNLSIHSNHIGQGRDDCSVHVCRSDIDLMRIVVVAQEAGIHISLSYHLSQVQVLLHAELNSVLSLCFIVSLDSLSLCLFVYLCLFFLVSLFLCLHVSLDSPAKVDPIQTLRTSRNLPCTDHCYRS